MTDIKPGNEAPARVLAMMVAANGRIDPRELGALEELDAYRRIGMPRERFEALARECLAEVGQGLGECSWLRERDQLFIDGLLDAVDDPQQRLLMCQLAAAVMIADGCVSGDERLVYEHALARWHISQAMVTQAILHDRRRAA